MAGGRSGSDPPGRARARPTFAPSGARPPRHGRRASPTASGGSRCRSQYSHAHWVNAYPDRARRRLVPRRLRVAARERLRGARARTGAGRRSTRRTSSLLLCTHAHTDHYGLAAAVHATPPAARSRWRPGTRPGVDVMREPTVPFERRRAMALAAGHSRRRGPAVDARALATTATTLDPIADLVLDGGRPRRARHVPGHGASCRRRATPRRRSCFSTSTSRRLISADLVFAGRIPYVEHDYTPDPWLEHVESLGRARALRPSLLLPGHGDPKPDADGRIAACTRRDPPGARADPRLDRRRRPAAPGRSPSTCSAPTPGFYPLHASLSGTLCVLDRLERVDAIDDVGRRRRRETPPRPVGAAGSGRVSQRSLLAVPVSLMSTTGDCPHPVIETPDHEGTVSARRTAGVGRRFEGDG